MKSDIERCMGCMQETNTIECPYCGYNDNTKFPASYLAPHTVLLGRYLVGKLISYNGEGACYLAFDMETNQKITIKEFMPDTLCTRQKDSLQIEVLGKYIALYKTYLSEFIALHKSLITASGFCSVQPVLNIFCENNTAYAVLGYINGISLKSYLTNSGGMLTWEQISELFPPVFTTLGLIHNLGIVHRGLSPTTIFVSDKNELKLLGFSISSSRTADSKINIEVFGGYAAPEQYSGSKRQGGFSDVYGICAVLYKALTGVTPQSSDERMEKDTLCEPIMLNRLVPANVSKVIMQGLQLIEENRIHDIPSLVDMLFKAPHYMLRNSEELNIGNVPYREEESGSVTVSNQNGTYSPSMPSSSSLSVPKRKKAKRMSPSIKASIIVLCAVTVVFITAIVLVSTLPKEPESSSTAETSSTPITLVTTSSTTAQTVVTEAAPSVLYIVPDLSNRSFETVSKSSKYRFITLVPTYEFNNEVREGVIISQDVKPKTEVETGAVINVTVSKGSEFINVPDYKDKKLDEYKEILGNLNIKYETKKEETNEQKSGTIIRCSKKVGDKINVSNGEVLVIYVASAKISDGTS